MKFINLLLLVLIILGIGLIIKRDKWVPQVVDYIIKYQDAKITK